MALARAASKVQREKNKSSEEKACVYLCVHSDRHGYIM